jgi:cobalt/nickel transport system permease protein
MSLDPRIPSPAAATSSSGSAALRLAGALVFVMGVALLPRGAWMAHGLAALALLAAALRSRVSMGAWLRRLMWLEPFAVGVAALALFQPGGLRLFLILLAKSTLCLAGMLLQSSLIPLHESLKVLRRWGVPALLVTTLALAHRYLFVLADEAQRMRRARLSRTLSRAQAQWWTHLSGIIAQLFLRTVGRAERIHAAMCARGWKP